MAEKSTFSHKLAHVGVVVRDIDEAVKRLESLGIGPFHPLSLPPFVGERMFRGKPMISEHKLLTAKIGEVELELFEPVKGESPWREFLDNKGEGIHHLAFAVDDLEKESAKFLEQGVSVLLIAKWEGGGGCYYLDLGAGGIIIELFKQ